METTLFHEAMSTDVPENKLFGSPSKTKEIRENACSSSYISDFPGNLCAEREKSARRSPTSNDEFWDALSSHYDYLMDDGLIATCREASSDLSLDDEDVVTNMYCWSFAQFIDHFKQLHDKLHDLQVAMEGGYMENIMEEQIKVASACKNFNEQGLKLADRYPDIRDEVNRHLNLLNNKWKAVEQSVSSKKSQPGKDSTLNEISTLVRCLRRWLKELEDRLCPVSLSSKWTLDKLEEKRQEQEVLQKEIKAKGKYVSTLLKRCECLDENETLGCSPLKWNAERLHRVATNLQKHWLSIYLKSLEYQAVIENLMFRKNTVSSEKLDLSISDEPVKKYPRLDDDVSMVLDDADVVLKLEDEERPRDCVDNSTSLLNGKKESPVYAVAKDIRSSTNDKGVMVGNTGIAELKAEYKGKFGKFELVQDVGYSSETSAHLSNDEQVEASDGSFHHLESDSGSNSKLNAVHESSSYQKCSSHSTPKHTAFRKLHLPPDKYPSYFNRFATVSESLSALRPRGATPKAVPDSFYKMTALDLDNGEDSIENSVNRSELKNKLLSSKDHAHPGLLLIKESGKGIKNFDSLDSHNKQPSPVTPISVSHPVMEDVEEHSEKLKRRARVTEWLNNYHVSDDVTSDEGTGLTHKKSQLCKERIVNDSCDASGEYTTTESDGEKSCVSDDVNNSLTFSQSFTGSVETVVKAVKEEVKFHSDRAGSAEPEPSFQVQMRRKKKLTRDRPWSVTELHQVAIQPSSFTHSTSEGALNAISYSARDSAKSTPCSKKIRLGFKKSSLTDVSVSSFTVTKEKRRLSQSRSRGSTDRSDECFSSKEECGMVNSVGSNNASSSRKSQSSYSSERNSASSVNSAVSKSRGQKHKRRFRSCHSESSSKLKSNSEESSFEKKVSNEHCSDGKKKRPLKCNLFCPEDQSSASEPVWDEYQDPPYLSEPYSEQTADEDQVKRLTNFGDDYRDILGSHSDGSSAWSTCKIPTRSRTRSVQLSNKDNSGHRMDLSNCASDTDDTEDFHNILATSTKALNYVQNCMKENTAERSFPLSSKYAEIVATCQTHLHSLREIYDELVTKPNFQSTPGDLQKLQGLIREWELLQAKLLNLSTHGEQPASNDSIQNSVLEVQTAMSSHKAQLIAIWACASDALTGITSAKILQENIANLQTGLTNLQEMKVAVLLVSARIRRLMAESAAEAVFPLRDAAAKLYQQWEDVYELSSSQLTKLQSLQSEWKENLEYRSEEHPKAEGELAPAQARKCEVLKECAKSNKSKSQCVREKHVKCPHQVASNLSDCDKDLEDMLPLYPSGFNFRSVPEGAEDSNGKSPWPPINTRSRLWRALRASMPFHLALVISYCISCLMEPQCCENINTLDFSLFPQLRHMQGPPPV